MTAPPPCLPCWPLWNAPGSACTASPRPGPRSTTSTCGIPGAAWPTPSSPAPASQPPASQARASPPPQTRPTTPRPEDHDEHHRRTHHLDDPTSAEGPGPPARVPGYHLDPASHLAVPVRLPVPQGGRATGLRRTVLPRLPRARGGGDDERPVKQHVERHDG